MTSQPPQSPDAAGPTSGPGSLGRLVPRAAALVIDWALCSLIAFALLHYRWGTQSGTEGFKPMVVFAVENLALVSTLGFTVGHRSMGLRVERAHGPGPVGFLSGATRTILLLLVVPAVVTDGHGRGLHDKIAGTVIRSTR